MHVFQSLLSASKYDKGGKNVLSNRCEWAFSDTRALHTYKSHGAGWSNPCSDPLIQMADSPLAITTQAPVKKSFCCIQQWYFLECLLPSHSLVLQYKQTREEPAI